MSETLLMASRISKSYSGIQVLEDVSVEIKSGEIHSIIGENGAGKSTLMNIIGGVIKPDAGLIFIGGEEIKYRDVKHAQELGVSMVHQELSVTPTLNIAENIFANRQPVGPNGIIKWKELYKKSRELLSLFKLEINPRILVKYLSTANQQLVEILRSISIDTKILLLDEPTSSLGFDDVGMLHDNLRQLREGGVGIVYVSHKISHVLDISDRITILRDGKHRGTLTREEATEEEIVNKMAGRKLVNEKFKKNEKTGKTLLQIKNFSGEGFNDINLSLKKGEVLGLYGLAGAGRTELARSIFGVGHKKSGSIKIKGETVEINSPQEALGCNLVYLPEDRKKHGLFLDMDIRQNVVVSILKKLTNNRGMMEFKREKEVSEKITETLKIKTFGIDQKVKYLSGGNQQKVLFGHWFVTDPNILIFDEPTRGIDVGTKYQIHKLLRSKMKDGIGILVISSDLPEVLSVCDRVLVMYEGNIIANLSTTDLTEEVAMNYATGRIK